MRFGRFLVRFYETKRFAVFRNFQVISMWFAVFLCYSVRCYLWYLCAIHAVFVPPLRPAPKRIPPSIRSSARSKLRLITQAVSLILIRWIVIYPADSAIQLLTNRGLISSFLNGMHGSDGFQLNF